jgi:hypothetical protein
MNTKQESRRSETIFGVTISIMASLLAVNELGAGKFAEEELMAGNEKTQAFMWYQSKSIKETAVKCQADLIDTLLSEKAVNQERALSLKALSDKLHSSVERYKKEKAEILEGSKSVGPENWAQDVQGEMGRVIGALEYEGIRKRYAAASDLYDVSSLLLQICLVLGAVGLILSETRLKTLSYHGMIWLGVAGAINCVLAYMRAFGVWG